MSEPLHFLNPPFSATGPIPTEYTCDGSNASPPLEWSAPPSGTQSQGVIVDDPDAPGGVFVHWILFNLPPSCTQLPQSVNIARHFSGQMPTPIEGRNDFGTIGYGGPCPPRGDGAYHYRFHLYALDEELPLSHGASVAAVRRAVKQHRLANTTLTGTYER